MSLRKVSFILVRLRRARIFFHSFLKVLNERFSLVIRPVEVELLDVDGRMDGQSGRT